MSSDLKAAVHAIAIVHHRCSGELRARRVAKIVQDYTDRQILTFVQDTQATAKRIQS